MRIAIEGFYRMEVFREDGTLKFDTGWFSNNITDQGLDALAQQTDVMTHYTVGTSSTAPANSDTWVLAFVATTSTTISNVTGIGGTGPYYGYRRQKKRFAVGDATGNLSEAVVGWSATTGTAFSRELIRDPDTGDPITITVLSDEYLEFTYELRYNVPETDVVGTCVIDSATYDYTFRACQATSSYWWADSIGKKFTADAGSASYHYAYAGEIGDITSVPASQSGSGTTSIIVSVYNPGDYYRDFAVSADTTQWNVSGGLIRSLVLGCKGNRWQARFGKVSDGTGIPKSGAGSLTMNWRISWARAA